MREIIFRGKRVDNDEWLYGDLCRVNEQVLIQPEWEYPNQWDDVDMNVIPETVGQFTGLTDKNGNKIFEGDVLYSEPDESQEVFFINGSFAIKSSLTQEALFLHSRNMNYYEVIGNIHESLTPNK